MEKRILLSCFTILTLLSSNSLIKAQTNCALECPAENVIASTTLDDGYIVPNFFESVVTYSSSCSEGEFAQSPLQGTVLEVGEYQVTTSLTFEGDTNTCSFSLVVNDGNTGGGKCVVACSQYLYVTPDSNGNYVLPDFFLNETIFIGGCAPTNKTQSPEQGTIFSGDTLQVFLTYTIDGVDGSCTFFLLMDGTNSVKAISDEAEITMYPNPASHEVNIDSHGALKGISIYDITGKKVLTTVYPVFDVSILNKGMYFVEIDTALGTVMKRLIVE